MDYRALVQKLGDRTNQNTQTSELILEHRTGHPTSILKSEQLTRAIVLEEYQHEDCYARVQYGIPNKFYPSLIKSLDLLLDIDVFQAGAQFITDWAESVKVCNHKAFEVFRLFIKP